jgi:ATP-dependent exoDNAse (exonuclease V) alpha subunit
MASFRLSAKLIKRSNGQSAVASAAYRSGTRLMDERTGLLHDFTNREGVVYSEILTPANAPAWMQDRSQLWGEAEKAERYKAAQLSREIQVSLPHELKPEQRKALLLAFVQKEFVARGMVADVNIHAPDRQGDNRNHHAHIMLTMRSIEAGGFSKTKAREWNDPRALKKWREQWAHHQNRALEKYGHAARVDHRSFKDRGIDREPQYHLGVTASAMVRKGRGSLSRIANQNEIIAMSNNQRAFNYRAVRGLDKSIESERILEIRAAARADGARQATIKLKLKSLETQMKQIPNRDMKDHGMIKRFIWRSLGLYKKEAKERDAWNRLDDQKKQVKGELVKSNGIAKEEVRLSNYRYDKKAWEKYKGLSNKQAAPDFKKAAAGKVQDNPPSGKNEAWRKSPANQPKPEKPKNEAWRYKRGNKPKPPIEKNKDEKTRDADGMDFERYG